MFQMGGIGPMFGQVGFFNKFAGKDYEDKRPRDRYVGESKRCSECSTGAWQTAPGSWATSYTIADVAT
jgi:GST-like protein